MPRRLSLGSTAALGLAALLGACHSAAEPVVFDGGGPVVLDDDGGWCWFQDERALALGDVVIVGSVAAGHADPARRGDVQLDLWWPASGETRRVVLHAGLELDDHDAPALLELPDGRLLAMYARHGTDEEVRWRRTVRAGDVLEWEPERSLAVGAPATYANLHRNDARGELLDLYRGDGWDPNLLVSRDGGESWEPIGRVLGGPGRPYVKYASNGVDAVHLVATEQHPRDFDNGLYHGVLVDRAVLRVDGGVSRLVGGVGESPPSPEELTAIHAGAADAVAWPCDLELDAAGWPVCVFTVQADGAGRPPGDGGLDHRFHYARFDGERWTTNELGHAGRRLYPGEDDYTGLAAIDPGDPAVVYLSTDADPHSGAPLISAADGARHRELFRAVTRDGGASWSFSALTRDSSVDNLRPIVPAGTPRVLLWLRGELTTYTDYRLEVVGLRLPLPGRADR